MTYGTLAVVKMLLNPKPAGSVTTGAITIGGVSGSTIGTTFARRMIVDADAYIDGVLFRRYTVPFGSPVPAEIQFISNRLAAAYCIQAAQLYTADLTANFLFDKQQQYYSTALSKLQALGDGLEHIKGAQYTLPVGENLKSDLIFSGPGTTNVRPATPGII